MTKMMDNMWKAAVQAHEMEDALREMAAFEQAVPAGSFYNYPLKEDQVQVGTRYRIFFRTPDGRFRLTPAGQMFAHKL